MNSHNNNFFYVSLIQQQTWCCKLHLQDRHRAGVILIPPGWWGLELSTAETWPLPLLASASHSSPHRPPPPPSPPLSPPPAHTLSRCHHFLLKLPLTHFLIVTAPVPCLWGTHLGLSLLQVDRRCWLFKLMSFPPPSKIKGCKTNAFPFLPPGVKGWVREVISDSN